MTKPLQYPENITRPMRHIHHSTIVWLDPDRVIYGKNLKKSSLEPNDR